MLREDPQVVIDKVRIQQIIINLVQNSVKYSRHGGTIELRVEHESTADTGSGFRTFNIHVTDQGQGIDKQDQKTLFEPKNTKGKNHGNGMAESHGLGLSICKSIAKSLGGDLSYVDDGRGSHFVLSVRVQMAGDKDTVLSFNNTTERHLLDNRMQEIDE